MGNSRKSYGKMNVVGDKIRYYREMNNFSYQKLSDMLMLMGVDIHKQSIYNIEKGTRTVVDYELCAFADSPFLLNFTVFAVSKNLLQLTRWNKYDINSSNI